MSVVIIMVIGVIDFLVPGLGHEAQGRSPRQLLLQGDGIAHLAWRPFFVVRTGLDLVRTRSFRGDAPEDHGLHFR